MRLELTGRHVEITPVLRRLVDKKLARLDRMLNESALSAQVVLSDERRGRRADVMLHARGEKFLHGVGAAAEWEASMSLAIGKIVQQAQRVKGKWQARKRRGVKAAPIIGERRKAALVGPVKSRPQMPRILRASRQTLKRMSVADAARQAEANGEGVIVFRDQETAGISVLYRRTNGELMLVETEP